MKLSVQLKNNIHNLISQYTNYVTGSNIYTNYFNNNVFKYFLKIHINKEDPFFVPTFGIDKLSYYVSTNNDEELIYYCPLYVRCSMQRTSVNAILSNMFGISRQNLMKITTPENLVYYGGSGIIINGDNELLMLCGSLFEMDCNIHKIVPLNPICYVSPKVFCNETDPVSKALVKKVIPYIASLSNGEFPLPLYTYKSNKVEIVIKDIDNFISICKKPDFSEGSDRINALMWRFIENSIS